MPIASDAFPPPSQIQEVDEKTVDQADWRNGALFSRMLDPGAEAKSWALGFDEEPAGFDVSMTAHLLEHRDNQFEFTPPGQSEEIVHYRGEVSFRSRSNTVLDANTTVERCIAQD